MVVEPNTNGCGAAVAGGLVISAGLLLEREPNANADVVGACVVLVEPNAENVDVDCGFGVSFDCWLPSPNEKPAVALAPPNLNVDVVSLGLFVSTAPNTNVGLLFSFDEVAPNLKSGLFSLEDEPNPKVAVAAGLSLDVVV